MVKIIYPPYYDKAKAARQSANPQDILSDRDSEAGLERSSRPARFEPIYVEPQRPLSKLAAMRIAGHALARRKRKGKHRLALVAVTAANLVVGGTLLHMLAPQHAAAPISVASEKTVAHGQQAQASPKHVRTPVARPSRQQIEDAQRILATPASNYEIKAKPYVDRILNNADLTRTIIDVSKINHSDPVSMIEVISAETSAQPDQFGPNKTSTARTAMQITNGQFIRLLGTYGKEYSQNMRAYAPSVPDHQDLIAAKADELQFVSQFIRYQKDLIHFEVRDDLYNAYMKQVNPQAKIVPLQQRINALWTDDIVSLGMQALSNDKDEQAIQADLVHDTHLGLDTIFKHLGSKIFTRGSNYMGKGRFLKMCEMMLAGQGNKKVVGTLMDAKTAERNFSSYPDRIVTKKIKKAGHIKTVSVHVPVTYRTETVSQKWEQQISKWDGIYQGISADLQRRLASRTVASIAQPQGPGLTG